MLRWALRLRGPGTAIQAVVTVRHYVYSFGSDDKRQIDVHIFNTVSLTWRKLTPLNPERECQRVVPSSRKYYTAVLIGDSVYVWGGRGNRGWEYCNDLYAFDVDAHTWSKPQVSGTVPELMETSSACVLEKIIFIHAGFSNVSMTRWTNDTYKLDTSTMVWTLITTRGASPANSSWHSATMIGTKMFVFGGWRGDGSYNTSIRVFDTENELWMTTPSTEPHPGERCDHSAFVYNRELYIFGGWKTNRVTRHFNDLWKLNPETFSWKKVEPKGNGPYLKVMSQWTRIISCCCMVGGRVIINSSDHLYILDLSPSLKTLCKLAVIQYDLERSELPHDIRWELAAMTTNSN